MLTIHVWPKRLKEFLLTHPLYKSPERWSCTNGNIYRVSKEERKAMGIIEEEKRTTPPPRGWSPAQKKNAHSVKEIVYDRSFHTTHHTKDRRHEQEKVYHKTRSGTTPDGQAARNAWDQELQQTSEKMVPKGNRLQSTLKAPNTAARILDQLNPQTIIKRRNCTCLRFTSGPSGLRSFC